MSVAWGPDSVLFSIGDDIHLIAPIEDLSLVPILALYGSYEDAFTEYLRTTLQPGMTFVDVGANVGLFTVIAGAVVGPSGKVIAYEPNPELFQYLARNVAMNYFAERTRIVDKAAHRDTTLRRLSTLREFKGGGSLEHSNIVQQVLDLTLRRWHTEVEWQRFDVMCERLDVTLVGEGFIDLVKIDTEGSEAAVIDGMAGLIADRQIRTIALEFRDDLMDADLRADIRRVLTSLDERGVRFSVPEEPETHIPLDAVLLKAHYSQLLVTFP